jgi:hypothetical protein
VGKNPKIRAFSIFLIYFFHVPVHDRTNAAAGSEKKFRYINFAFHAIQSVRFIELIGKPEILNFVSNFRTVGTARIVIFWAVKRKNPKRTFVEIFLDKIPRNKEYKC